MADEITLKDIEFPNEYKIDNESLSYKDALIQVFASLANTNLNNCLTVSEYQSYEIVCRQILGEESLSSAEERCRILRYLLNPLKLNKAIQQLVETTKNQKISKDAKINIANHAVSFLESTPQIDLLGIRTIKSLINDLSVPLNIYAERIDTLVNKVSECNLILHDSEDKTALFSGIKSFISSSVSSKPNKILRTAGEEYNQYVIKFGSQLLKLAQAIDNQNLIELMKEFHQQLKPQPCKIALVGEMKHGKSSIFNSIIGSTISPVGESTATTSAILELYYSEDPAYEAKWLEKSYLEKLNKYIEENKTNSQVKSYGELLEKITQNSQYCPGEIIEAVDSISVLDDYVTAKGKFSIAVQKIKIGLNIPELKYGAIIVDTPGINDPTKVRDFITIEESKTADCIVFVMRADKFGTESERKYLLNMLRNGRTVNLIIVITHIDRASSDEEAKRIVTEAENWFRMISKEADSNISNVKIYAFDARNKDGIASIPGFDAFWDELASVASDAESSNEYIQWVLAKQKKLIEKATEEKTKYLEYIKQFIPDDVELSKSEELVRKHSKFVNMYKTQVMNRLNSIKNRLMSLREEYKKDIRDLQEDTLNEIKIAIDDFVHSLGNDYHNQDQWKDFGNLKINKIFEQRLKKFIQKYEERSDLWNTEIKSFSEDIGDEINNCFITMEKSREEHLDVYQKKAYFSSFMCKTDKAIGMLGKLTVGGAGIATVGAANGLGIGGALITTLGSQVIIPIVAVGGGLLVAKSFLSNPAERKRKFIEKRLNTVKEYIESQLTPQLSNIDTYIVSVWETLILIVTDHSQPLILEALASEEEARMKIEIAEKIKKDNQTYVESVMPKLPQVMHG